MNILYDPLYLIAFIAMFAMGLASVALGPREEDKLPRWQAYAVGVAIIWIAFAIVQYVRPAFGMATVYDLAVIIFFAGVAPIGIRVWLHYEDLKTTKEIADKRKRDV